MPQDAGLQFVLMEKIHNAQLLKHRKKNNEHALHI
jgi:hypothetical protein